jgi:hypothetical protein
MFTTEAALSVVSNTECVEFAVWSIVRRGFLCVSLLLITFLAKNNPGSAQCVLLDVPLEIHQRIMFYIKGDLPSLHALSRTCMHFRITVLQEFRHRVHHLLQSKNVRDPSAFLEILRRTRGVVSGPSTLQILFDDLRHDDKSIPLDIHLPNHRAAVQEAIEFLCRECGYVQKESFVGKDQVERGLDLLRYTFMGKTVIRLVKLVANMGKKNERHVSIFVGESKESALLTVVDYPTTAYMNLLAYNELVLLYPLLTAEMRGLVNSTNHQRSLFQHMGFWQHGAFDYKYRIGLWPEYASHKCSSHPACPRRTRDSTDGLAKSFPISASNDVVRGGNSVVVGEDVSWRLSCAASCRPESFPNRHGAPKGKVVSRSLNFDEHYMTFFL